ncbi:MAG TPA: serine/threonine-protein kinase [Candidatus Dormibacteraeota bacterium]|nr:serine/threonine-protein kinase [Candidatus Dormibacteraeota bacterium]
MESPEIKKFGRYEIVGELGRGAMGIVYKARDPQIDRLVALKTVSLLGQEPDEEKEFRLRFTNEAQAAGRLHHPGIVAVFDVGESPENRDPYIVLEYVAGESLNRVLARERKLPLPAALTLTEEIADALGYAHEQGVIHRDIKPANILVTQEGHAKIADFGIAKLNLAHFTLPGKVLGTPAYMAPEQLSGEGVDGRSDLFSLGVILYALVTGHSPFQGDSATTVCFKVANREPIAASALDMSLPPQLDAVISRAMAKDPRERYQRGADFAEDLRILRQSYKPGSTTTSRQGITATGTRSGTRTTTAVRPAATVASAEAAIRNFLSKARIRDLVLAAAAVASLVIIAAQLKLFDNSPKVDPGSAGAVNNLAEVNPGPAMPAQLAPSENVKAATASSPSPRKSPAKASHAPARQIVVPSSTIDLAVQHQFKDATLYVWVDDKPALTLPLHGAAQKKLVVFNGVRGVMSQTLKVPAGKRVLRFRALSADKTVDLSKTLSADFVGGDTKSLQVSFDKHNSSMRLTWQ